MSRALSKTLSCLAIFALACNPMSLLEEEEESVTLPRTEDGQPMPFWDVTNPAEPKVKDDAPDFSIVVHSIFLKGECGGEGKKGSSGIQLVINGEMINPTDDTIHRAVLTGALYLQMNDDISILRSSGGSGFDDDVDSDKPWRPQTARSFSIETRAIDAIYCEYEPKVSLAALHLRTKSPLGGKLDAWVKRMPVHWQAISGMPVINTATLTKALKPKSPFKTDKLPMGTLVDLQMVWRDKGLVKLAGGNPGWLPLEQLKLADGELSPVNPGVQDSASWTARGIQYELSSIAYEFPAQASDPSAQRAVIGQLKARNLGERAGRCSTSAMRMLHSKGAETKAVPSESLRVACAARMEPGGSVSGRVRFILPPNAAPVAVGEAGGTSGDVRISAGSAEPQ